MHQQIPELYSVVDASQVRGEVNSQRLRVHLSDTSQKYPYADIVVVTASINKEGSA